MQTPSSNYRATSYSLCGAYLTGGYLSGARLPAPAYYGDSSRVLKHHRQVDRRSILVVTLRGGGAGFTCASQHVSLPFPDSHSFVSFNLFFTTSTVGIGFL